MNNPPQYIVVHTTCPTEEQANQLANALVEQKLAACVQACPVQSTYRWYGTIEKAPEVQLQIKTTFAQYTEVERLILATHPYETPEILAFPVLLGSGQYLAWLNAETQ